MKVTSKDIAMNVGLGGTKQANAPTHGGREAYDAILVANWDTTKTNASSRSKVLGTSGTVPKEVVSERS